MKEIRRLIRASLHAMGKKTDFATICMALLIIAGTDMYSIAAENIFLPIGVIDRSNYKELAKRSLNGFGAYRTAGHKHAGLDIGGKYEEPVYSIGVGIVRAIYGEYPYKTVLIEHQLGNGEAIFSGYTHIEDISVVENDLVDENTIIGRMFDKEEYMKSNFYKNHIHFEIRKTMERYQGISIKCKTTEELNKYFYDPSAFFRKHLLR
jgi:murein DD-endopeptidase MepM/ murein hydrolase activator NlpD